MIDRQTNAETSLGLVSEGIGSAADWIGDKVSAKATARFAGRIGSRIIPGIGTALLAYEVADLGYTAITGHSLSETSVGKAVGSAVNTAGRTVMNGTGRLFDSMGFSAAGDFIRNDASYFFGAEVPAPQVAPSYNDKSFDMEPIPFGSNINPRSIIDQALKMFNSEGHRGPPTQLPPAHDRSRARDFGLD